MGRRSLRGSSELVSVPSDPVLLVSVLSEPAGLKLHRSCSAVLPHMRPWQIPRPARVPNFRERKDSDSVAFAAARIAPKSTSSQRQITVESVNQPDQPDLIPCAASMRCANPVNRRRRPSAAVGAVTDPAA